MAPTPQHAALAAGLAAMLLVAPDRPVEAQRPLRECPPGLAHQGRCPPSPTATVTTPLAADTPIPQLTVTVTPTGVPPDTPTATATPTVTPLVTATPTVTPTTTLPATATPPPTGACDGIPAYPEIRSVNTQWNATYRGPLDPAYRDWIEGFGPYYDRITGDGCLGGTTEQILEFYAVKWGLDQIACPDSADGTCRELLKAGAVMESDWYERIRGDYEACTQSWCWPSPGYFGTTYQTYGLTGVKRTAWGGSWGTQANIDGRFTHESTNLAADWYGAALRAYYDGAIPWAIGTKGDIVKSVAAWYCGCDSGYPSYSDQVFTFLREREWTKPYFKDVQCSTNCEP